MSEQEKSQETVQQKLSKKERDLANTKHCNICGSPRLVEYQEKDDETGKVMTKTHIVECCGHYGVPSYLWNLHKDYDDYQKFYVRQKERTSGKVK